MLNDEIKKKYLSKKKAIKIMRIKFNRNKIMEDEIVKKINFKIYLKKQVPIKKGTKSNKLKN